MRKNIANYVIEAHRVSVNRACRLVNLSRSIYRYKPKWTDNKQVEQALHTLAERYRRYGFEMMFQKIRQQSCRWSHKCIYRVYCEMHLNLRCKPKKRLPFREKVELAPPEKISMS